MNYSRLTVLLIFFVAAAAPLSGQPTENRTGPSELEGGTLPGNWRTGGPNCLEQPRWQVHEYNPNFFILRESGCIDYEKPFLYLIFGRERALLEDTGSGEVDTAKVVMDLISQWCKRNNKPPIPLLVVHSHGHSDHTAGDSQLAALPNVQVVPASVAELQKAFGISKWPTDIAQIDLGARIIDLIPIPGHEKSGIALYDRATGVLLTGDSVYPGRLYVSDVHFADFVRSNQRLVDFTRDRPVAHILGAHIEQTRTPFVDYPTGTKYQPDEHDLALSKGTLLELNEALGRLNGKLEKVALRDLTLSPVGAD